MTVDIAAHVAVIAFFILCGANFAWWAYEEGRNKGFIEGSTYREAATELVRAGRRLKNAESILTCVHGNVAHRCPICGPLGGERVRA